MKLLVLDRDGVINQDSDAFIKSVDEWQPIPGSIEAIARLSALGYSIYVATNQSGLGRGLFSEADLQAMHTRMTSLVQEAGGKIEGVYYCPHHPDTGCDCRKPLPGLLKQIAHDTGMPLAGAPMVGDSLRDLQAGDAVSCQPVLVKTGKGQKTLARLRADNDAMLEKLPIFDSLAHFADHLQQGLPLNPGEH